MAQTRKPPSVLSVPEAVPEVLSSKIHSSLPAALPEFQEHDDRDRNLCCADGRRNAMNAKDRCSCDRRYACDRGAAEEHPDYPPWHTTGREVARNDLFCTQEYEPRQHPQVQSKRRQKRGTVQHTKQR